MEIENTLLRKQITQAVEIIGLLMKELTVLSANWVEQTQNLINGKQYKLGGVL